MKRFVVILALFGAGLATADGNAGSLGSPGYGGSGCPGGSASARLSGSTLTVRYRSFKVSAGQGRAFDRKVCSISLPVRVSAGRTVSITGADYRGNARLPAGATAKFRVEYFFAGRSGQTRTRKLNGPVNGPFSLSTGRQARRAACGQDVILRINTSVEVSAPRGRRASLDVANSMTYRLQWHDC